MVTTAQVTKKIIESRPILQESLLEGIINYANLAEKLQPKIEAELGSNVKTSAVIMALRRYSEKLQERTTISKQVEFNPEIVLKTNLCDVSIVKTHTALEKISDIYKLVDYEKGDTLNIIQGNYELTIVISQKYLNKLKEILGSEKVLNIEKNLVSLTLEMSTEFLYTPGTLALATRKLAWENINIFENISTLTELIFIIAEKDAVKAYNTFQELLKESSNSKT
jgi:aspartokinase